MNIKILPKTNTNTYSYEFYKWNADCINITSNLTVKALFNDGLLILSFHQIMLTKPNENDE